VKFKISKNTGLEQLHLSKQKKSFSPELLVLVIGIIPGTFFKT